MSITTRQGDTGQTCLFSGERVPKYADRIEAVGELDELVSALGVARCWCEREETRRTLLELQRELFIVGAELATTPDHLECLAQRVDETAVAALDARRDELERQVGAPRGFVIPGEARGAALLDLARAIARRCERRADRLFAEGQIANPCVLVWLNRLSDYLWLLARSEETSRPLAGS